MRTALAVPPAFAGTEYEGRTAALRDDVERTSKTSLDDRQNKDAAALLDKATEHVDLNQFVIARLQCRYITEKFPDTRWADEAEELLARIAELEAAPETDEDPPQI